LEGPLGKDWKGEEELSRKGLEAKISRQGSGRENLKAINRRKRSETGASEGL